MQSLIKGPVELDYFSLRFLNHSVTAFAAREAANPIKKAIANDTIEITPHLLEVGSDKAIIAQRAAGGQGEAKREKILQGGGVVLN